MKLTTFLKRIESYTKRKRKPVHKPFYNIVQKEMEEEQKRLLAKIVISKAVEIYQLNKIKK